MAVIISAAVRMADTTPIAQTPSSIPKAGISATSGGKDDNHVLAPQESQGEIDEFADAVPSA
jgi:hypothetical protein